MAAKIDGAVPVPPATYRGGSKRPSDEWFNGRAAAAAPKKELEAGGWAAWRWWKMGSPVVGALSAPPAPPVRVLVAYAGAAMWLLGNGARWDRCGITPRGEVVGGAELARWHAAADEGGELPKRNTFLALLLAWVAEA